MFRGRLFSIEELCIPYFPSRALQVLDCCPYILLLSVEKIASADGLVIDELRIAVGQFRKVVQAAFCIPIESRCGGAIPRLTIIALGRQIY